MAIKDDDQIFTNELIRDTVNHDSITSESEVYIAETVFIKNGLNQDVTLQMQGGLNSDWVDVGSTFVVSATSNGYKTVTDYFFKYRVKAICATQPTSGGLDVWFIKRSG